MEVCKYVTKFSDLSHEHTYHVYEIMGKSMRLIDSHGVLRGVKVPEAWMKI